MKSSNHSFRVHWFERLIPLLLCIVLLNTIQVFQGYWWDSTFSLIYCVLLFAVFVEMLLPMRKHVMKRLLQATALILFSIQFSKMTWNGISWGDSDSKLSWIIDHLVQLHPFFEIALAMLLLQIFYVPLLINKNRLYIFFGMVLLILTIRDSFSPLKLWWNIVIVVVVFLVWHSLLHIYEMSRTFPSSERHYLYKSFMKRIPLFVIMIGMMVLIAINIPSLRPLLEDPYTIWKASRGESVPAFLGNKGFLNQSLGEKVASSGYSRDDSKLGGGFQYNYDPVMIVETSQRSYWRGESRAIYTGQGWDDHLQNTESIDNYYLDPTSFNEAWQLDIEERQKGDTVMVSQNFQLLDDELPTVLFSAPAAVKLSLNDTAERNGVIPAIAWYPEDWRLINVGSQWIDKLSYEIESEVLQLNIEKLQEAEAHIVNNEMQQIYTQLPGNLPNRVAELASQITVDANSDFEKAQLLEQYLRSNYSYTNLPDTSLLSGNSNDFVDQFLFELMQGYCDYFSTAMVVMARTLDLPARWVKGFAPGSWDKEMYDILEPWGMIEDTSSMDTSGVYTVRNSDAHSWVEIYFEGFGWVSFEPTPGFSLPSPISFSELPEQVEEDELELQTGLLNVEKEPSLNVRLIVTIALTIVMIIFFIYIVRHYKEIKRWLYNVRYRSMTNNEKIIVQMNSFLRYCRWRGLKRLPHQTMREAIESWDFGSVAWKQTFSEVIQTFEVAKYSKDQLSQEETEQFEKRLSQLKRTWKS